MQRQRPGLPPASALSAALLPAALPSLALLSLSLLSACATAPVLRQVAADRPFSVVPGESVSLPDASKLRYVEVAADSRCPPGVVCVRAGDADVVFGFTAPGAVERRVTINTDATAATPIGGWRLRLLDLARGDAPAAMLQATAR